MSPTTPSERAPTLHAAIASTRRASNTRHAIELIIEHPVVPAPFLSHRHEVSHVTANKVLQQLVGAAS